MLFTVGQFYGNKTFNEIKEIRQKLVSAGVSADKIKLLTFYERGSIYIFLKNSGERFGCWNDVGHELGVC